MLLAVGKCNICTYDPPIFAANISTLQPGFGADGNFHITRRLAKREAVNF